MTTYSNYTQIIERIAGGEEFIGNTMLGEREDTPNGVTLYRVWSYDTPIAFVQVNHRASTVAIYRNERKYSVTTSKHQNVTWRGLGALYTALVTKMNYTPTVVQSWDGTHPVLKLRAMSDFFEYEARNTKAVEVTA
jgi:hypothetical protein